MCEKLLLKQEDWDINVFMATWEKRILSMKHIKYQSKNIIQVGMEMLERIESIKIEDNQFKNRT